MTATRTNAEPPTTTEDYTLQDAQRMRLQRFSMALITYVVVILATFLVTSLGLGEMSAFQWTVYIGLCIIGNSSFFLLFYTNQNLRFADPSLTRAQIIYSALWGMVALYSLPEVRPIVLMFYLPAFSFGMFKLSRKQYSSAVAAVMGAYGALLILERFLVLREFNSQYELFLYVMFGVLLIWFAYFGGSVSNLRRRLQERNKTIQKAHTKLKIEIHGHQRTQKEKDDLIVALQDALSKVKTMSGLLPICASCKKIRDDSGYWSQIEFYISEHSNAEFSHGICPDCEKRLYPDYHNPENEKPDPVS